MFYEPSTEKTYNDLSEFRLAYCNTAFGDMSTERVRNIHGLFTIYDSPPRFDGDLYMLQNNGLVNNNDRWQISYTVVERPLDRDSKVNLFRQRLTAALEAHIENVAREKHYDNKLSILLRTGFKGPFQKEAIAYAQWMDNCSVLCYEMMDKVTVGEMEITFDIDSIIKSLPTVEWP